MKTTNTLDEKFMAIALTLARRGLGNTWPNPAVGCVLVRPDLKDRIVGRGWTQPSGRPHAETEALHQAGPQAKGATAYATLEPCCHQGQTPPCSKALISAGISRVVIATQDPDERVAGQGVADLQQAGIDVTLDILKNQADEINAGFFSKILHKRPIFTLKTATTLDGKIATATGESQWITGDAAREQGHALRATHDGILTGIGTVLADDPSLTCRLPGLNHRSPVRIVLDTRLRIESKHQLITSATDTLPTWIVTSKNTPKALVKSLSGPGVSIFQVSENSNGSLDLADVASLLAEQGMTRVLVEAGSNLNAAFIKAGLIDKIIWFRASKIIGGDGISALAGVSVAQLANAPSFRRVEVRDLGSDIMEIYGPA